MLIAFAGADELPRMDGARGIGSGTPISNGTVLTYATGNVALNRDVFNNVHKRFRGAAHARATVMHELGPRPGSRARG